MKAWCAIRGRRMRTDNKERVKSSAREQGQGRPLRAEVRVIKDCTLFLSSLRFYCLFTRF